MGYQVDAKLLPGRETLSSQNHLSKVAICVESTMEKTKQNHTPEQKQLGFLNFFGPVAHWNDLKAKKFGSLLMSNISKKYSHVFTHEDTMDSPFQLSKELILQSKGKAPPEVFYSPFFTHDINLATPKQPHHYCTDDP